MTRPQDHFKPHLFRASHSGSSGSRQCLRAWLKRRSGFGKALRRSWRAQLGALNHRINGDCGFFSVTTWTQLTQLTQFSSIFINFPSRRGIKKVWRLSWKATFLGWLDDSLLSWLQWFKFDPWLAGHATSILWMDLFLNGSPDTHQTKTNSWYSSTVVSHNWHDFLY